MQAKNIFIKLYLLNRPDQLFLKEKHPRKLKQNLGNGAEWAKPLWANIKVMLRSTAIL